MKVWGMLFLAETYLEVGPFDQDCSLSEMEILASAQCCLFRNGDRSIPTSAAPKSLTSDELNPSKGRGAPG